MTFYEAALEVLRKSGRALHYKKITEVAIRDDLLAHVGRTPLIMMEQRLEFEAKKGDDAWIFQTRPGVYSLKEDVVDSLNEKASVREKKEEIKPKEKRKKRRSIEADMDRPSKDVKKVEKITGTFDSVADAAYAVLLQSGSTNPVPIDEVANVIFRQKLVGFHTHEPELSTESALLLDNAAKIKEGMLPRFTKVNSEEWVLTRWAFSKKSADAESKIAALVAEIEEETKRELSVVVSKVSKEVYEMLITQLLSEMKFTNVKIAKRTNDGEVILSANRQGFSDTRICIFLANSSKVLESKHLKNFKKSLGHYSASEGIVIHLGKLGKDLVKSAKTLKLSFLDQKNITSLLFEYGIGITNAQVSIKTIDTDLIKKLS